MVTGDGGSCRFCGSSVFVIVVVVVLVVVDVVSGGPWTTWRGSAYLLLD